MKESRSAKEKKSQWNSSFQLLTILISLSLSSCSYFKSRNQVQNPKEENAPKPLGVVPKVQYDQLLSKYEQLLNEKKEKAKVLAAPKGEILAEELVETVDVFESQKSTFTESIQTPPPSSTNKMSQQDIEKQIQLFQRADMLSQAKKYDESMIILRELENSSFGQIRVRVKYLIGHLLFEQKEYDLAMQKFEEIISQHSFSGVIIKTLKKLIQCSQALGLDKKRERYYSILHDFFES